MGALGASLGRAHPPHRAPPPPLPLLLHLLLLRRPAGAPGSAAAQAGAARGASLPQDREQSLLHGRGAGTAPRRGELRPGRRFARPVPGAGRGGGGGGSGGEAAGPGAASPRCRGDGQPPPSPRRTGRAARCRGFGGGLWRAEVAEPGGCGAGGCAFLLRRLTASSSVGLAVAKVTRVASQACRSPPCRG